MKFFQLTAAAALVAASLSASAMTTISDDELSTVSGQDGVSIVADLNINIGAFTYTDTDATGGSVSFNNITVRGLTIMEIDVLNAAAFQQAAGASVHALNANLDTTGISNLLTAVAGATGWAGQDVVQFAFPATGDADAHSVSPTITVGAITTGHTTADANGHLASFGSLTIQNLDLQGTKVWMYAH